MLTALTGSYARHNPFQNAEGEELKDKQPFEWIVFCTIYVFGSMCFKGYENCSARPSRLHFMSLAPKRGHFVLKKDISDSASNTGRLFNRLNAHFRQYLLLKRSCLS